MNTDNLYVFSSKDWGNFWLNTKKWLKSERKIDKEREGENGTKRA